MFSRYAAAYITIDTEYSAGRYLKASHGDAASNYACSIAGKTPKGAFGIGYQMDLLERYGLKAVFSLIPCQPWFGVSGQSNVSFSPSPRAAMMSSCTFTPNGLNSRRQIRLGRTGGNIKDFSLAEQTELIAIGTDFLERAGRATTRCLSRGQFWRK